MQISGMISVGNGENCPFCEQQDKKYIVNKDTDIVKHMLDEHKNDFNSHIFGENK